MIFSIFFLPFLALTASSEVSFGNSTILIFTQKYFHGLQLKTLTYISCDKSENDLNLIKYFWNTDQMTVRIVKTWHEMTPKILNQNIENGVLSTFDCLMAFEKKLNEDTQRLLFRINMHWLIFGPEENICCSKLHFPLNSDVKIADLSSSSFKLTEHFKLKPKDDYSRTVIYEGDIQEFKYSPEFRKVLKRRKDFNGTYLRCAMTVAFPELWTGLDDIKNRHIDTYARGNWPIVQNLRVALNFNLDMFQVDSYGWNVYGNGTFTGLIGLIQRREIEFGANAALMRPDRIFLVDRTAETLNMRALVFFRQPHLSTISNIFILPFDKEVWFCIILFLVFSICATYLQVILYQNISLLDSISMVIGAVCQQGHDGAPSSISGRIIFWMTFLASLFIFTSYSACIVALLQSPSHAIKDIDDLVNSPLRFGAHNMTYNHVYFKEATSKSTKNLYNKKILPQGDAVTYTQNSDCGMHRVQKELFAFQTETQMAYKYIKEHFYEYEKCQLGEIELFKLPATTIAVQKDSQFREIFTVNLRRQREIGLINHAITIWIGEKERCRDHAMHFNSVGLTESKPAFMVLLIGIGIAFSCFIIEQWKVFRKVVKNGITKCSLSCTKGRA